MSVILLCLYSFIVGNVTGMMIAEWVVNKAMKDVEKSRRSELPACGGGMPGCKGGPNCTSDHK